MDSEIMNQNWFLFSDLGIICPGPASAAPTVAAPAGAAPWEAFGGGAEPKRGGPIPGKHGNKQKHIFV